MWGRGESTDSVSKYMHHSVAFRRSMGADVGSAPYWAKSDMHSDAKCEHISQYFLNNTLWNLIIKFDFHLFLREIFFKTVIK
jgi:hypothetical protein